MATASGVMTSSKPASAVIRLRCRLSHPITSVSRRLPRPWEEGAQTELSSSQSRATSAEPPAVPAEGLGRQD